jgi:hypothetical protein
METQQISPGMLVAEVLAISPLAAPLFIEMRLDCPGCTMHRFCTLEDLGSHYGLELHSLITTLYERLVQNASH